jgi:hypothetical protein
MEPNAPRPWWMTVLAVVCTVFLLIVVPSDLFVADARNTEVWLGFEAHGWLAILTAPIHWAMFAVAAWAFWTGRRWIVPWAAAYLFYVAVCHLVWSRVSPHGRGWPVGLAQALAISACAVVLLRVGARSGAGR